VLKITPAHDHNDYEIGQRHKLEFITIFNKDGTVNEKGGHLFQGLNSEQARIKIWKFMSDEGLTLRKVNITHRVPRSQRGGEVIEPMLSTQWFLTMDKMASDALKVFFFFFYFIFYILYFERSNTCSFSFVVVLSR
jgi:valyl-tRNA synthetase